MTADQWVAQAQQIYDTACQTYYTYRCTSDCFTYDNSDTTEDGYVRITSCRLHRGGRGRILFCLCAVRT